MPGGFKKFIRDMYSIVSGLNISNDLLVMPNDLKRDMYEYRIRFLNPVAGNNFVSGRELKEITDRNKYYFHEKTFDLEGSKYSCHDLFLIYSYLFGWAEMHRKNKIQKPPDIVNLMKQLHDAVFSRLSEYYILNYYKVITQKSSPDHKYYGIIIRASKLFKECPRFEFVSEIFGYYPRKRMFEINGIKRPAFQLAKPMGDTILTWLSVDSVLLKDFYSGQCRKFDIYIQSHALKRMSERLDLLNKEALDYAIWQNTNSISDFKIYRNYLFLPFKLFDVEVGYLLADIVEDCLLFRTFLFITHNSTPEGDRLKKQTGLGKEDIMYWHIDRLSTFVGLSEEKYPRLFELFASSGLGDLVKLKEKSFDIDTLQEANLDGLLEYMQKGKAFKNFAYQQYSTV